MDAGCLIPSILVDIRDYGYLFLLDGQDLIFGEGISKSKMKARWPQVTMATASTVSNIDLVFGSMDEICSDIEVFLFV